jgi:dihydroxy-acid dehydratase
MTRTLRSNFPRGSSLWAVRRAQWRALGLTDADMEKPKIAVVNTSSELAICFSHLDRIVPVVKEAIRAAGGLPFEVRTAAPSDFIHSAGRRGTYILPSRDLIVNDIEVQVEGAQLDGMVCLTSCDKTIPGQLMAAARLNIPSLLVICGYQASGAYRGHHMDIEEVFLGAGHHATGRITLDELKEMSEDAIRSPGVCSGMGTANSMHCVCEGLGMSLPGGAPVLAMSPAMLEHARASGQRIVEMVWEDLRPRSIMTRAAFSNAAAVVLALTGSINCIKHLQATAVEAGLDLDVYQLFEDLIPRVPVLCAVRPNGDTSIEELEAGGGARAVLKQLGDLIQGEALTVTGKTVAENLAGYQVPAGSHVRARDAALSMRPGIVIVRGSLAPDGGIVKMGLRWDRPLRVSGRAKTFSAWEQAFEALKAGRIVKGDVVVLRGIGVKGGPGMGMASRIVFALDGAGLGPDVPVVTDGQLSGLVNKGLVVGEVTPEAAVGGPLGLVEDGDTITIDVEKRTVDLELSAGEMATRSERFIPPAPHPDNSWVNIYERSVQPLARGAALVGRKPA